MNNLYTNRKNNIYKIYTKLNDSYRRCTIERDGQRYHNTTNIENFQTYTFLSVASEDIEPHIVNKPCSQTIVAIYRKKWYGQKWNRWHYSKKRCKKIKYKIINSKEILLQNGKKICSH